jgi:hypothetical protein
MVDDHLDQLKKSQNGENPQGPNPKHLKKLKGILSSPEYLEKKYSLNTTNTENFCWNYIIFTLFILVLSFLLVMTIHTILNGASAH